MKEILLWLWQLPQNIIGVVFGLFIKGDTIPCGETRVRVRSSKKMSGGISLGKYVYLSNLMTDEFYIRHEIGHCAQSRMLGPLYLIVIGLPSLLWAALYRGDHEGYYRFYTESWAQKLGGNT